MDGFVDCFLAVSSLDFFYTVFPSNLKSTSIALSTIMYTVGDYLGVFMITASLVAYLYGRDESCEDDILIINGREYPHKIISSLSAEIERSLASWMSIA